MARLATFRRYWPSFGAVMCLVLAMLVPRQAMADESLPRWLYAATAGVQALDVHSTVLAMHAGAEEANPLIPRSVPALIGVKAGGSTALLLVSRRAHRTHPRATT